MNYDVSAVKELIDSKLLRYFNLQDESVNQSQMYTAVVSVLRDLMLERNTEFKAKATKKHAKRVYYISMEFLLGRNMRNVLYNLGLTDAVSAAVASYGHELSALYDMERDPGLGNGGLGRLAACYMDAMSTLGIPATGFSILYEYGIFRQKIVDGYQSELPDEWLSSGEQWLIARNDEAVEVHFGGKVEEVWDEGHMRIKHSDYFTVQSVPYTLPIPGYGAETVNELRLWQARAVSKLDLKLFSLGQYSKAVEQNAMAEVISKVLYPDDNHFEGKSLRLKQQYFLVSSTVQYIMSHHYKRYGGFDSLPDMAAIQINDTHPALVVPELMRIMMDDYGYEWDRAWNIVRRTVAYTNHTVMPEALETWPGDLFRMHLPRIYNIVCEINRRFCQDMFEATGGDWSRVAAMSIINDDVLRMANLSIVGSHKVNGVSALHSEILKTSVFNEFAKVEPDKFCNVTNGIAHRRWLCQANPMLDSFIAELIGTDFRSDASKLLELLRYENDSEALVRLERIKKINKERLASFVYNSTGQTLPSDMIFDVQVKRLHEYKRQLMNILRIVEIYIEMLDDPGATRTPHAYIFGAKASQGYKIAKQIIHLINRVGDVINSDSRVNDKLRVLFLEDYRVTSAEIIIPAAEISEQISQAGKEASGTGNMKFMLNGALTIGTLDGANVEIHERVGDENMFLFGLRTEDVNQLYSRGYQPTEYYQNDQKLQRAINALAGGMFGESFSDITHSLLSSDNYMVLADINSYREAHDRAEAAYCDRTRWNRMSLINIAQAGIFSADRSIRDYSRKIWHTESLIHE